MLTKSKSQFKALLNAAIYAKTLSDCWKNTLTHTENTRSEPRPSVKSCAQNASSQADADSKWPTVGRARVWEQSGVFCV